MSLQRKRRNETGGMHENSNTTTLETFNDFLKGKAVRR
jgi:hypothetical protein